MYHRITTHVKGLKRPTWNVTPRRFRAQLAGLLSKGYQPQPLSKMLRWHAKGRDIPSHWFVVTFDDVYENVHANAWPVLKQLNIPATLFLATAYLDSESPFPFDDWSHAGSPQARSIDWRPITTKQCQQMQDSGLIELGAHTHSHDDFRGRPDDLYEDLLVCKQELKTRFGVECPAFAFPYGTRSLGYSGPALAKAARRAGLTCSLTTEDERVLPDSNPFDWGRFTAEPYDSANTLAAKLEGSFTNLKSAWGKLARAAVLA